MTWRAILEYAAHLSPADLQQDVVIFPDKGGPSDSLAYVVRAAKDPGRYYGMPVLYFQRGGGPEAKEQP